MRIDDHIRAAAELELRRRERTRKTLQDLPLLDFVPEVSPAFEKPVHLAPFADRLELIDEHNGDSDEVRLVCHTPPRHGKTELLIHLAARTLLRRPTSRIGYATYSGELADRKSNRARRLARSIGVDITTDKASEWRTSAGGGFLARGVGGGWTGRGLDLLIVDDPIKDRAQAESPAYRRNCLDWFNDAAYTRLEPGGSVVVNMARWHPGDLAGGLIEDGWKYLRLPAICDSEDDPLDRSLGEALWPIRWPLELLQDRMRNEYTKASLYQGRPRPRGATVFKDVHHYTRLPDEGFRSAIGLDLAYTAKSRADYSVAIALLAAGDVVYVVDVLRAQVDAASWGERFRGFQERHFGTARIYTGGGAEVAAVEYLERDFGVRVKSFPVTVDKFVRAQPVSTAWNEGRILLPASAPWLADFIEEVCSFTGVGDVNDDQVDALAAGFDEVATAVPFDYQSVQTRRYSRTRRGWA